MSAFLERLSGTKVTITHEWDIINAIAGAEPFELSSNVGWLILNHQGNFDDESLDAIRKSSDVEHIEEDGIVRISTVQCVSSCLKSVRCRVC